MNTGLLNYYFTVLKSSQDIRQGMSNHLQKTGRQPDKDEQEVFNISAEVMGKAFDGLIDSGHPVHAGSNPEFYETEINGVKFLCHKNAITKTPPAPAPEPSYGYDMSAGFGMQSNPMNTQNMGNQQMGNMPPQNNMNPQMNQGFNQGQPQMNMNPQMNQQMNPNMGMGNMQQMNNPMQNPQMQQMNQQMNPVNIPPQMGQMGMQQMNPNMGGNGDMGFNMSGGKSSAPEMPSMQEIPTNQAGAVEGLPQPPFPGTGGDPSFNAGFNGGNGGGGFDGNAFGGNPIGAETFGQNDLYGENGFAETQEQGVTNITSIGNAPIIQPEQGEVFTEERTKSPYDFLFDTIRISIAHINTAGSPEEMHIMIAPLLPPTTPQPSVPIVAAFYHKAGYTVKSSYDEIEDGKNLIIIDIGDYSFLCRGSVDANGNFVSSVVTTGMSAQQSDRLTIIDRKQYGRASKSIGNGHIKFTHDTDMGKYIFDVFPFDADFNDYIVVSRGPEFVDNLVIGNSMRTASRAIVWGAESNFEVLVNKNDAMGMIEAGIGDTN